MFRRIRMSAVRPRGESRTRARCAPAPAGELSRNRCSATESSVRYPSSSSNPPRDPRTAYTGIPARLRPSMSRRTVRSETSSSPASCFAVRRPRACSKPSNLTSRLARIKLKIAGIHDKRCQVSAAILCRVRTPAPQRRTFAMTADVEGSGTKEDPWILTTPPGKSEFEAWRDETLDPPALVVQVGTTQLRYQLRCIEDLHTMLN